MKKSEGVSKKALKVVERVVRNKAEKVIDGEPPYCLGIYHQPKRPKQKVD
ncbi:MAG: cyclic lactone autoinducer peptide [Clostridia bacterium]|nr:cyclic lactone autoinducer peptide [Clostridia bacterium]